MGTGTFFSRTKRVPEFVESWANARMEAARIRTNARSFIGRETNRKPDVAASQATSCQCSLKGRLAASDPCIVGKNGWNHPLDRSETVSATVSRLTRQTVNQINFLSAGEGKCPRDPSFLTYPLS
jgi:hypothetical protein